MNFVEVTYLWLLIGTSFASFTHNYILWLNYDETLQTKVTVRLCWDFPVSFLSNETRAVLFWSAFFCCFYLSQKNRFLYSCVPMLHFTRFSFFFFWCWAKLILRNEHINRLVIQILICFLALGDGGYWRGELFLH